MYAVELKSFGRKKGAKVYTRHLRELIYLFYKKVMTLTTPLKKALRVVIVGSGPSAFYAADELLKNEQIEFHVDMLERLPTPYGLVRGGVAPDHLQIKGVIKIYERIALKPRFQFWGNVEFGRDVQRAELLQMADCIIYAVGSPNDRPMKIPGEDLAGSYSATEFVGWYNGHPDFEQRQFTVDTEAAAVIGMGNVAIDVARILAKTPEELALTDMPAPVIQALAQSQIKTVYLIGRRGPAQAAFTPVEARELFHLKDADPYIDPMDLELDPVSRALLESAHHRNLQQDFEILKHMAETKTNPKPRAIHLKFLLSPMEILAKQGRVHGLRLVKNQLLQDAQGNLKAKSTGIEVILNVGLVFRAIGYDGSPLPGLPYDAVNGVITNDKGRVTFASSESGMDSPRDYVVGWAKRGPTGVIGTNKHDSIETVHLYLADLAARPADTIIDSPGLAEGAAHPLAELLRAKKVRWVSFADWKKLDAQEIAEGQRLGKPREKFTSISAMLKFL